MMKMNGDSGKQSRTEPSRSFNHDQLNKALMDFEDLAARAFVEFYPRLITADCVKRQIKLEGDAIYVGVSLKHMRTRYAAETISSYIGKTINEMQKDFEYMVGKVPVKVQVYKKNWKFYQYPDRVVYEYGDYMLPNPFNDYWKARFLVK